MIIHVVKQGESIYSIASKYKVSPEKLIADNELPNPNNLVIGQTIVILQSMRTHSVQRGESLFIIAKKYGISVQDILDANPNLSGGSNLYPGEAIAIPSKSERLGTIEVNGYALPGTNLEVISKTLPSLTYLSIFSYEVRANGSLSTINDTPYIQAARAGGVAPIMVITNTEEGAGFSSEIAHRVLTDQTVQDRLIGEIVEKLRSKNYSGLNIDFEYIYPYDRQSYNQFLRKITQLLRRGGYVVFTAVAPKNSADQQGLLYEAHDYPVHGATVDKVIIMTYEWGYSGGPPLPVAPINLVRRVLDYAVQVVPRKKILMGCPNYGYNWQLPYRPGTTAPTISNTAAVELASRVGANIQFDEEAKSPFFTYYDAQGIEHIVWFQDARTARAQMLLVNEYGLAGVSYWTIGTYFAQNFLVLNNYYKVRKVL